MGAEVNRQQLDKTAAWVPSGAAGARLAVASDSVPGPRPVPTDAGSPSRRGLVFAGVLVLHLALIAALLLLHGQPRGHVVVPPIQISMINDTPHHDRPVAPRPELERTQVTVATPDVPRAAPAPDAPTNAPAAPSPPPQALAEKQLPAPAEPVTPPRFDAAYLKNPPPAYPPASRRLREQGTVVMRVRVSAEGNAGEVSIEHSSGSSRLDEAAVAAVRHWRFVPAHRGAVPVEAWVLVPLGFELQR